MRIDRELFRTGVAVIDEQHEAYLALVERLFALCRQDNVARQRLEDELKKVLEYAVEHFDTEELVMRSLRYPHYEEHLAKHNMFRDRMDDFFTELRSDVPVTDMPVRLSQWLVMWIARQVQTDDRRLAAFLQAPGESANGSNMVLGLDAAPQLQAG